LSALLPGTYRADGQGARDVEFLAPPDCEDPRAALEALLGQTFARFTVAAPLPRPKPAPVVRLELVLHATGVRHELPTDLPDAA